MQQKSLLRLIVEPIAVAVVLAFAVRSMARIYTIPSDSMEPALRPGDNIVVTPYRFGATPRRGEVVVFQSPRNPSELVVKRVIATPGDLVGTTARGEVTIGGKLLAERYVRAGMTSGTIPLQIVPSGCYFVMGDNRRDSLDSRSWGVLPGNLIVGRARLVLWSSAADSRSAKPFAASAVDAHALTTRRFFVPVAER